jgi:hypothetical protein
MKFCIAFVITIAFLSCKNEPDKQVKTATQAGADSANYTSVTYLDSVQNLGVLTMGDEAQVTFDFKNSGNKPLYIIDAAPSCGCTVADFPKEPLAPDSLGKIVALFDTKKSHVGDFTKVITVTTNTKPSATHVLTFSGQIVSKDGKENHESAEPVATPKADKTTN